MRALWLNYPFLLMEKYSNLSCEFVIPTKEKNLLTLYKYESLLILKACFKVIKSFDIKRTMFTKLNTGYYKWYQSQS